MKLFTRRIFTHRRIIFIFLLAIFIPSLIAAYLSLSTFPKRREAVKKLLESNLWISGEAALKTVEEELLEQEQKVLSSENFMHLMLSKKDDHSDPGYSVPSEDSVGQLFLLDGDFKLVIPESMAENAFETQWEKEIKNSRFEQLFKNAEFFEFSQKNFAGAAELYKKCISYTNSEQCRAAAYEGLGRCLIASQNYEKAEKVFNKLSKNYGQIQNKAGHPYGITAMFQLYQIARERKEDESSLGILLNLLEQIIEGAWPVNKSAYDFYVTEIESILKSKLIEGKFPDIQKSFSDMQKQKAPYKQTLLFIDFLQRNGIPEIKEKLSIYQAKDKMLPERFLDDFENNLSLVSYTILPDFQPGQTFYGGFRWDFNYLKNRTITKILAEITKESGLNFKIVDSRDQIIPAEKDELKSDESMTLAFRAFPLPYSLLVSHPEIKAIERTARREILFYGIFLSVIVALMLLGAVLIARDVARESETNRLKTEFVNNISHELKTPLTLIRLYGETLQRKNNLTNEEKKDCYEIITKESERLSHLINNVLDFSRVEMGRKEFDFRKGYLQDVITDTLESYRYHLEKKGFVIHSDIARDLHEMNFDGEAIASVLINLLSNAIKFSTKEKEVTVKLFRDKESVVLLVADKGIGISQREIPKIFERFYQSDNNNVSEAKGSGLGLTLVKNIIEAHGGKIEVESEVGKGSVFTVRIPLYGI